MRTYSLFDRTKEQQKVARVGNREIRIAVDKVAKEVKRLRAEKRDNTPDGLTLLAHVLLEQHVTPVLQQYREAGANDTEPRELIAQELCETLGVFVSSSF